MSAPEVFGMVLLERRDGIAIVTMNRPERRNALGGTLLEDIVATIGEAGQDCGVRAIALTDSGSCFCAGEDLLAVLDGLQAPGGRPLRDKTEPQRNATLLAVYEAPKPVIAAVNGPALDAGMNLALAADIRIASTTACLCQSHVLRGLTPDHAGTCLLPRLVGHAKTCELMYTRYTRYTRAIVDAQEALRLGLVTAVVKAGVLLPAVLEMARRIARNAPLPVRLAKHALQQCHQGGTREALDR